MTIKNEICLCTNQVLYNLTRSGLLVPLFVIFLSLREASLPNKGIQTIELKLSSCLCFRGVSQDAGIQCNSSKGHGEMMQAIWRWEKSLHVIGIGP